MEKLPENSLEKMKLSTKKNLKVPESIVPKDYDHYRFSVKEFCRYFFEGICINLLFSYVFYKSFIAIFFLIPVTVYYLIVKNKEAKEKRKEMLASEFSEMMGAVNAALHAGYSVENAFTMANKDMVMMFGEDSDIAKESKMIIYHIRNNINIEDAIDDLARRSKISDIREFAEVFKIAKRSGGDMPKIIKNTSEIISEKIDIKKRILTLVGAKKMESSIMNVVPFAIILYIDASSPGFFEPLYHNLMGIIIMTVLIVVYVIAYSISKRIVNIAV